VQQAVVDIVREVPASYAAAVAGGSVRCNSPRSPRVVRSAIHADYDTYEPVHSRLSVSLNAADYDTDVDTPFQYYDPPGRLSLSVTSGSVLGGTPIVITGANLTGGTDRRCRFVPVVFGIPSREARRTAWAMKREVAASVHAASNLRCVTPALPERAAQVTVEVALNGQQFTHEGHRLQLTPREGALPLTVPENGAWGIPLGALAFVPDSRQQDPGSDVSESEVGEPLAEDGDSLEHRTSPRDGGNDGRMLDASSQRSISLSEQRSPAAVEDALMGPLASSEFSPGMAY